MVAISSSNIYVALVEEGLTCWRPVSATHLQEDVYRISDQIDDGETLEFLPGETVRCKQHTFPDGVTGLLAFERISTTAETTLTPSAPPSAL
jgi:hypothetical protein